MDVQAKLQEIGALVEGARAMPMSASCIVNRQELLAHLAELADLVPTEVSEARSLLRDRGDVLAEGRREAERLVDQARQEQARLVDEASVVVQARAEAERIVDAARAEAERLRRDVDDYVDAKLANFEVVLTKTLRAVERGRAKLRIVSGAADAEPDDDLEPLPD